MKKALLITLIALMSCMLMTTALAADFTTPGEYVKHVSFDEIRPGIVVAGDDALKNTPTFASGTTELTFWGLGRCRGIEYLRILLQCQRRREEDGCFLCGGGRSRR